MKFFLPFWFADHISKSFDTWRDTWERGSEHWRFLWELPWKKIPFDGILISRFNIEKNKRWKEAFEIEGVHRTLRLPSDVPIFGDCGAWGYIEADEPPYEPKETLEFYRRLGFTYACTIDHIIFPATYTQRFKRLEVTIKNAEKMKHVWDSDPEYYGFQLVGVVQGWDTDSYYESAKIILDMNFDYIALGGQARSPSKLTRNILKRCHSLWKNKDVKVHVFGLARWNLFESYLRFGVTSFDNAYHRKAWLSATHNYEIGDNGYTAVRIPLSNRSAKNKNDLEKEVICKLRDFELRRISAKEFLKTLADYDPKRVKRFYQQYLTTLRDRPWEKCDCPVCKAIGIHVCIFRTNERNMRRGFHNLWNFYRRFKQLYPDALDVEKIEQVKEQIKLRKWF